MEHIDSIRNIISLNEHGLENTETSDNPGAYSHYDDTWTLDKFKQNFRIDVKNMKKEMEFEMAGTDSSTSNDNIMEMEFDMIGIDASIANAFRRILIAEVPTMAVEKVFVYNNTSIIQDEVLAHRLGLIPIKADPRLFEMRQEGDANASADNTLEFELKVRCTKNPKATEDTTDPDEAYLKHKVFTEDIKWLPIGQQANLFSPKDVGPVHDTILIAKLRPGQEIDVKMHCVKGIGRDHIKFSPVATASYRLLSDIQLTQPITGKLAEKLQNCFPEGVVHLKSVKGVKKAKIVNSRLDTCSREVLRHDDLKNLVKLGKIRDHFIFSVESTGALAPDILVCEAIKILSNKCRHLLTQIQSTS